MDHYAPSKSRKQNTHCAQPQGHIPQELIIYAPLLFSISTPYALLRFSDLATM